MATTVTRLPMQRLGTDHWRPAALTSIVGGTVWDAHIADHGLQEPGVADRPERLLLPA